MINVVINIMNAAIDNIFDKVDKLVAAGADVLMLVPIGPKQIMGTVVDYAYYVHNLVSEISSSIYHIIY